MTQTKNEYQIGDMVFCSNTLAIISDISNSGTSAIYSVKSGMLVNGHSDMEPEEHILPVPITIPTLSLLGEIKCNCKASYYEINRNNLRTEGFFGRCFIDLDSEYYLTVESLGIHTTVSHTNLWRKETENVINCEKDDFFSLYDKYEYIHEIQHLVRALKYDLNIEF